MEQNFTVIWPRKENPIQNWIHSLIISNSQSSFVLTSNKICRTTSTVLFSWGLGMGHTALPSQWDPGRWLCERTDTSQISFHAEGMRLVDDGRQNRASVDMFIWISKSLVNKLIHINDWQLIHQLVAIYHLINYSGLLTPKLVLGFVRQPWLGFSVPKRGIWIGTNIKSQTKMDCFLNRITTQFWRGSKIWRCPISSRWEYVLVQARVHLVV